MTSHTSHTVRIDEPILHRVTYERLTGDQATRVVANQRARGYRVDEQRSRPGYTVLVLDRGEPDGRICDGHALTCPCPNH